MLRHELQPGRLVAGFFVAVAGLVYAGDAGGLWDTPWFVIIPIMTGGLCLAGATATLAHGIRKGRGLSTGGRADGPRPVDPGETHAADAGESDRG
ncbi:hypothetical protein [Streptomyces sp. NRRL B-1347]|uniref:hypothetical protein n=1 Tax=Streptomyces sp. NRRL B-1347 TaxID=1476877 RepID=UPI0006907EF5|nr:hypothetical protein [Streptomyces sp. NRRL B-1347]